MTPIHTFRTNTVDAGSVYVAISRARKHAAVYTDSRAGLTEVLGLRDGAQVETIDEGITRYRPGTVLDGPGLVSL